LGLLAEDQAFGRREGGWSRSRMMGQILSLMHAKWLKERHVQVCALSCCLLTLSRFAIDWPGQNAPLSGLRARLAELTHLPPAGFKIIHAGAVMKDDDAPRTFPVSPPSLF
jgi:hypothetical protein